MSLSAGDIEETVSRLRAMPDLVERAAKGLTDEQLRRPPGEKEWSVHELLAHLRGASDVQGGWIAKMLAEDTPTIRYVSARSGMKKTGYESQTFEASLATFVRSRAELVEALSSLDSKAWSRTGSFTGTTPGWAPTVYDLARGIATHEHSHAEQITATAAAVGAT
jgi:uncharacterized damage-inducible protein DinB